MPDNTIVLGIQGVAVGITFESEQSRSDFESLVNRHWNSTVELETPNKHKIKVKPSSVDFIAEPGVFNISVTR